MSTQQNAEAPTTAFAPAVQPTVSVIVPCRDEEHYIERCLDSIVASTYPRERLEVIVADGRSVDRTREIVARYAAVHPWIRLVDNPGRTAPTALNAGIREAKGDLVVRMDAHAVYPAEYLVQLAATMAETGADNVGGRLVTLPAREGAVGRAIALALSHPFGVGNSHFRIGSATRRWVDTVPFGCYRREVFERVGLFDEELVRNQDDEFNFRLARRGGRVLLDPAIVVGYYARRTLKEVARTFYQYGYFKPLVARKVGRVMTVRQLVPALFVLAVFVGIATSPLHPAFSTLLALGLGLYAAGVLYASVRAAGAYGPRTVAALMAAFPTIHLSYGFGFLRGTMDLVLGQRRYLTTGPTRALAAEGQPRG